VSNQRGNWNQTDNQAVPNNMQASPTAYKPPSMSSPLAHYANPLPIPQNQYLSGII